MIFAVRFVRAVLRGGKPSPGDRARLVPTENGWGRWTHEVWRLEDPDLTDLTNLVKP